MSTRDDDRLIEALLRDLPEDAPTREGCPSPELVAQLAEGTLGETDRESALVHMADCPHCRRDSAVLAAAASETVVDPVTEDSRIDRSRQTMVDDQETLVGPVDTYVRDDRETAPGPFAVVDREAEARAAAELEGRRMFGPYRVVRELGSGGMGVVHEVVNTRLDRVEALKLLRGGLGDDAMFQERFHRETKAMASLAHDHVVTVYDFGEREGQLYYTMPLMPGASLEDVVDEIRDSGETVPGTVACEILDRYGIPACTVSDSTPELQYARRIAAAIEGVADALSTMHEAGMVHRDVKPANLMIDAQGRVLLADFGLVRAGDVKLTAVGQMLGTPAYMSPEQVAAKDRPLDGRADVYALGASLYELLTLHPPLRGQSTVETISMVLDQRPKPVTDRNPGAPHELSTLVATCLEKSPELRYDDAAALRDDLARFARGEDIEAQPIGTVTRSIHWLRHNWLPTAVAAGLVGAIGVAGALSLGGPAHLTVASLPGATVYVNGEAIGETPLIQHEVESGEHQVRLLREGFHPVERTIELASGGVADIDRTLLPLDPADPVALAALAEAIGVAVASAESRGSRGGDERVLQAIAPRGLLSQVPTEIVLASPYEIEGAVARISAADGTEIAEWEPQTWTGVATQPLPETVTALLAPGGSYRITVELPDMEESTEATFEIADVVARATLEQGLTAVDALTTSGLPADHPSVRLLRGQLLLAQGLHSEALAVAMSLREELGDRRSVVEFGLAVLEQAELQETEPWIDWLEAAQSAK